MIQLLRQINFNQKEHSLKYYDMKISDEALSKMEIVFGIKISDEDRTRIYRLVQSINKNIILKESSLNGLLRLERI